MMLTLLVALALSACGASEADATPTLNVELVRTQAVLTYQVELTQTALANPTSTPTATLSPTPAATLAVPTAGSPIALSTAPTGGVAGGASGCYNLAYVADVTIPDGTQMTPGQSFTKTWRVSNTGTCAWEAGFTFNVVSGDAMGASAVTLNQRVEAGRQFEISVPMVAPTNKTGSVRGDWRMADANGSYFGQQVYVEITVSGSGAAPTNTSGAATTAPTSAATAEATAEATSTGN
jgi:hypothetical protein